MTDGSLNYWEMLDKVLQAYEYAKLCRDEARRDALAVLLIQLVNGCYLSEALEAFKRFSDTGERIVQVRAAMKQREVLRTVVIPGLVERGRAPSRGTVWQLAKRLGFGGTRALVYAFLNESAREGLDVKRVLTIMGQRRMSRRVRWQLRSLSPVLSQLERGLSAPPNRGGARKRERVKKGEGGGGAPSPQRRARERVKEAEKGRGSPGKGKASSQLWEWMSVPLPRGIMERLAQKARELGYSSIAELVRSFIYYLLIEEAQEGGEAGGEGGGGGGGGEGGGGEEAGGALQAAAPEVAPPEVEEPPSSASPPHEGLRGEQTGVPAPSFSI